jgi:hypothetical protein
MKDIFLVGIDAMCVSSMSSYIHLEIIVFLYCIFTFLFDPIIRNDYGSIVI